MTDKVDIAALAKLARLDVSAEEMAKLEKEIPNILGFVETIQKVSVDAAHEDTSIRNVMRDDTNPHESGEYTEKILANSPSRTGDSIAVKQVISRKK